MMTPRWPVTLLGEKLRQMAEDAFAGSGILAPMVAILGTRNPRTLEAVPEGGLFLLAPSVLTEDTKGRFADSVRELAAVANAYAVAFLCEMWCVEETNLLGNPTSRVPPSEDPRRVESVYVQIEHRALEGTSQPWKADILRMEGQPPTLKPWVLMPLTRTTGRLTNLLPPAEVVDAVQAVILEKLAARS